MVIDSRREWRLLRLIVVVSLDDVDTQSIACACSL